MVKSIGPLVLQPAVIGSTLYFFADDGTHGMELWPSDGMVAGTHMVKNLAGPDAGVWGFQRRVGSHLYFSGTNGTDGQELWTSD
jgi:ELWxxDGT repeat protein